MGLLTAISTLTIIPVPYRATPNFGRAIPFFPLVGLGLGATFLGSERLLNFLFPHLAPDLRSAILVLLSTLLTGALHLDGLGDTMDSLGGQTKEKRLTIMKDKHMGAFGIVGISLDLLIKFSALKGALMGGHTNLIVLPFVISRATMAYLSCSMPYAREEGTGRPFIEEARPAYGLLAWAFSLIISLAFGIKGILALGCGILLTLALKAYFRSRYGGITGDLLGASNEIVEVIVLVLINLLPQ